MWLLGGQVMNQKYVPVFFCTLLFLIFINGCGELQSSDVKKAKEFLEAGMYQQAIVLLDKRINDKLIVPKSANKIYEIDSHIIASVAGIISDARVLIERSQVFAQQHRVTYDSPVEPELIIKKYQI